MGIQDEHLWKLMEEKARQEDADRPTDRATAHGFIEGVRCICEYGINRAKTIRDTFPLYTLHDETHIINVARIMWQLLGDDATRLSRDESAMLLLCACCHDIGMSYSESEKTELLEDFDRIDHYLEQRDSMYVRAYAKGLDAPILSEDMQRDFFRSIHHERVRDLLYCQAWPKALDGRVDREDVVRVCQSHGNDAATLSKLDATPTIDLRMCAVLLRLADILDFDETRTPWAIFAYNEFNKQGDAESAISEHEWKKHLHSKGFDFEHVSDRTRPYELPYSASCDHIQVEQSVRSYVRWVDEELFACGVTLRRFVGRWQDFVLPQKVHAVIEPLGYKSGAFELTLDHNKVLDLLVGDNMYGDPSVFVRELIQNAIDAVRTRIELDKNPRRPWKPQINIRTWTDDDGYHWFRIQDNGIGMTEEVIRDHLLKVGSSYYTSDGFRREKLRQQADPAYTPISRFGIGLLSCFMGNKDTGRVEISTKHYEHGSSAIRLEMNGTHGYYKLSCKSEGHHPGPMRGQTHDETREYLPFPGTVVAVRTNLFASETYASFKEIVDRYVAYPCVPIHYEGEDGESVYQTEDDLLCAMRDERGMGGSPDSCTGQSGVLRLRFPLGACAQIQEVWPGFTYPESFAIQLSCLSLKDYTPSPHISGTAVFARTVGEIPTFDYAYGSHHMRMCVQTHIDKDALQSEDGSVIAINVVIRPSGVNDNAVNRVSSKYKKFVYSDDIIRQYEQRGQFCLASILQELRYPSGMGTEWRSATRALYGLTEEELDLEIEHAREIIHVRTGLDPNEIDLAWHLVKKREWRFVICDVSALDWYAKDFNRALAWSSHRMAIAHNGIFCGAADSLFRGKFNDSQCLGAILLLKDKLRPELTLARDNMRGFTLETQLALELMRRGIQAEGHVLGEDYPAHGSRGRLLALREYKKVLECNPSLAHELALPINGLVPMRINDVLAINPQKTFALLSAPLLAWDNYSGELSQQYLRFCMAYVTQHFTIYARFNGHMGAEGRTEVALIRPKDRAAAFDGDELFPPAFFVEPLHVEDTALTTRLASRRHWLNAAHPLSAFLVRNATILHERTPGILREFVRTLAEDDAHDLIGNVNSLIRRLHRIKNSQIRISFDLELSMRDLC